MAVIEATGLGKIYPDGTVALKDLDLTVMRGEMLYIRGHSGAGKTTLFRLLMGMESPTSGSLVIDGHPMDNAKRSQSLRDLRREMGIIFQDFRLIKGRTSLENVEMGLRVLGFTGATVRNRAMECLERVNLAERAKALADSLSWGERQRLEVARALAREPSLILADEPTGNLDQAMSECVLELLLSACRRGATVLVITHAPEVLEESSHRVITLDRGSLVRDSSQERGGDGPAPV